MNHDDLKFDEHELLKEELTQVRASNIKLWDAIRKIDEMVAVIERRTLVGSPLNDMIVDVTRVLEGVLE